MSVIITVRGESRREVAPEQVRVFVSAHAESDTKDESVARAKTAAATVHTSLTTLDEQGLLADWSSTQVRTWTGRTWVDNAEHQVEAAAVDFTVTFADVDRVRDWIDQALSWPDVQLNHLHWQLTDDTHDQIERQVATEAIAVATQRATAYADALGLSSVVPVEVADTGLMSASGSADMFSKAANSQLMRGGDEGLPLTPEPITVSATVEARFQAD